MQRIRAVGLLSGGLDSTLAVKLMLDQGIDVVALNFRSPFCQCDRRGRCEAAEAAAKHGIPLHMIVGGDDYLRMLRNPKHGYGSGMNPCIDCRILMLKKAKSYARKIGAKFLFTGEVLGERPMSQHRKALEIIEKETGLKGKILRPLSAKLLPPTQAELRGWVNREKLLNIKGRSRKPQIALAASLGIFDYPCPAGGCLLTDKEFAAKLRDLFNHRRRVRLRDIAFLKVGRHFRLGENKMIVGRDEAENKTLLSFDDGRLTYLEVPDCGSPVTVLQGRPSKKALLAAARLTARYSDAKGEKVPVSYRRGAISGELTVEKMPQEAISSLRISKT
jgi:tRNA U34 2-thiouridine synthase MnmA/TrmU